MANRVTRHPGVPFWILCFLFCHRGKAETSDGKRQLIRGGGSIARISNDYGPQDVAREYDVPRGWTSPLFAEARVPPVGTVVQYVRPDCSDFCVPDDIPELLEPVRDMDDSFPVAGDVVRPGMSPVVPDSWPRFAEARVPPVGTLYIVLTRTVLIFVERTVIRSC